MAFSKAKALQEAEKFVTQGKLSLAIKQYLHILEKDPSDLTLLNAVGDLYVRDKNLPEALKHFGKLAEAYSQEGFTVKSIAIYKKISKIDPTAVEVLVKAGDLYVLQGLAREARDQYGQAIEFYRKRKQNDKAIEIYRKVVALDPSNASFHIRLADMCEQAGKQEDAAAEYREAAELALRIGDTKAAEASLKKAASLDGKNPEVQLLRARLALVLHQPEEAEKILSDFADLNSNPRAQQLLLEAYLGTEKLEKAQELVIEMVRARPEDFAPVESYAKLCIAQGNNDAAVKTLSELAEALVEAKQGVPLIQTLRQVTENDPRHLAALELLYTVCKKTGDDVTMTEVLEGLGHACAQSNNLERAEWAFETLVSRDPTNQSYKMLLKQVLRKEGKTVEAEAEELAQEEVALTSESAPSAMAGELSEAEVEKVKTAFENSDLYSQYGLTEKAVSELEKVLAEYPDQIDIHRRILEICLKNAPERASQAAKELERIYNARGDAATAEKYRETAATGAPPPVYESPAALTTTGGSPAPAGEEEAPTAPAPAEAAEFDVSANFPGGVPEAPSPEPREIPLDLSAPASEQAETPPAMELDLSGALGTASGPAEVAAEQAAPPSQEFDLSAAPQPAAEPVETSPEQLEVAEIPGIPPIAAPAGQFNADESRVEVDFYLDQGFVDEARKVVQELEQRFPGNPGVAELRQHIEERAATPAGEAPETAAATEAPPESVPATEEAAPVETEAPTPAAEMPPAAQPITEAPPAPQATASEPAPAAAGSDLLGGLVGELESSLDGLEIPAGPASQPRPGGEAELSGGTPSAAAPSPFGDLLEELGEGAGAEAAEDPQTHYDLGVAFREMSLLDEAIGEFQKVVKGSRKGHYPPNFLQACTLLATCFMDKQMPGIAAKWYLRALETPNLDDEATLALHYDLGVAYEQAGDARTALEKFSEVYSQNIDYRDVAEKIRELRQKKS